MKKAVIAFIVLAVLLCALVVASPVGNPDLTACRRTAAMSSSGRLYLAETRPDGNWVYGVDGQEVAVVYRLPLHPGGDLSVVKSLASDGTKLVALQMRQTKAGPRWNLSELDGNGRFAEVYTAEGTEAVPVSVNCENGEIFCTFIESDGTRARVTKLVSSGEGSRQAAVCEALAPFGERFTEAGSLGGKVWGMLGSGRLYRGAGEDGGVYPAGGKALVNFLSINAGTAFLYDRINATAVYSGGMLMNKAPDIPGDALLRCGAAADGGSVALVAVTAHGAELLRLSGDGYVSKTNLVLGMRSRLAFKLPLMLAVLGALALVFAVVLAMWLLLRRTKRVSLRLAGVCTLWMGVAALVVIPLASMALRHGLTDALLRTGEAAGAKTASAVKGFVFDSDADDTYASSAYHGAVEAIAEGASEGAVVDITGSVIASPSLPTGVSVRTAYSPEVEALVMRVFDTGKPAAAVLELNGAGKTAFSAQPLGGSSNEATVLLTGLDGGVFEREIRSVTVTAALLSAAALVLISLFSLLVAGAATRPMRRLVQAMRSIAEGKTELPQNTAGADEVGEIWNTMKEMSASLAMQRYQSDAALASYYRFVPRRLDELIGRASVMDVSSGDAALVRGSLALVAATNRGYVRSQLNDAKFMDFVNLCYDNVDKNAAGHGGLLLENTFSLASLRVFFDTGDSDILAFSIAMLDRQPEGELPAPSYFVLLHTSAFLYGVTGSKERAFSFMASAELDFLTSVSARFEKINCRLVVTDRLINSKNIDVTTRYIGYVASPDGQFTYKLYEVLEVYHSIERSRRQQYMSKFQDAVNLYYRNEFHKARNAFSSMLKICPTDGVARWYLFACEYYFGRSGEDLDHGLFGAPV